LERLFSKIKSYAELCKSPAGSLKFNVYSNKDLPLGVQEISAKFHFNHYQSPGRFKCEKELSDLMMIRDTYRELLQMNEDEFLHVLLISADKDFHNLFTELRRNFSKVRTHSLSAQTGSALSSLADYALEMDKIYLPEEHALSPQKRSKSSPKKVHRIEDDEDSFDLFSSPKKKMKN
jgi:hypothetical protein